MGPELLLSTLLLAAAAWSLATAEVPSARGRLVFAVVGAAVVISLVWRVTVFPGAAIALVVICTTGAIDRTKKIGLVVAAAALSALAVFWPAPPPEIPSTGSPPEETTRALDRGNLYEARFWAARWARMEGDDPRDGALIWARVENLAGHGDLARQIASDVATRARTEPVRARARGELASFGSAGK